jgi:hypothetical protein
MAGRLVDDLVLIVMYANRSQAASQLIGYSLQWQKVAQVTVKNKKQGKLRPPSFVRQLGSSIRQSEGLISIRLCISKATYF